VGDFSTLLSPIYCSSISKTINKETLELKHTMDQMDLTDIYRTFHPRAAEYTYFSAAMVFSSK
jgi:exonuclease III